MLAHAIDGAPPSLAAASSAGGGPGWDFAASLAESSRLVFRVAFSVLRQREDAEDVAQDAFLKAYRTFHQLRDRQSFHAWLSSIARRLALDRYRKNRRQRAPEGAGASRVEGTTNALIDRERAEKLRLAIDALPEKLRVVVLLADIEEHDIREVARLAGVREGTVKSRLFAGRKRLKERLQRLQTDRRER